MPMPDPVLVEKTVRTSLTSFLKQFREHGHNNRPFSIHEAGRPIENHQKYFAVFEIKGNYANHTTEIKIRTYAPNPENVKFLAEELRIHLIEELTEQEKQSGMRIQCTSLAGKQFSSFPESHCAAFNLNIESGKEESR